jgi:hypothetical protein
MTGSNPASAEHRGSSLVAPAIPVVLIGLAALGWLWSARMSRMDMDMAAALTLASFLIAWIAMMAAMMFPAIVPVVQLYARAASQNRVAPLPFFVAGYLIVWSLIGLPAFLAWRGLMGPLAMGEAWAARLAGAITPRFPRLPRIARPNRVKRTAPEVLTTRIYAEPPSVAVVSPGIEVPIVSTPPPPAVAPPSADAATGDEAAAAPETPPEPPAPAVSAQAVTVAYLRTAPSTAAVISGSLPPGTPVTIVACSAGCSWYLIQTPSGSQVWSAASWYTVAGNLGTLPVR